jgi:hypothetical protein
VLFGGQSTENDWTTDTTWILDTGKLFLLKHTHTHTHTHSSQQYFQSQNESPQNYQQRKFAEIAHRANTFPSTYSFVFFTQVSLTWREVMFDFKPRCRDMGSLTLLGRAVTYSPSEKEKEKNTVTFSTTPSFLVPSTIINKTKSESTLPHSSNLQTKSQKLSELKKTNSTSDSNGMSKKVAHKTRYAHLYGGNHGGAVNDSYLLQIVSFFQLY